MSELKKVSLTSLGPKKAQKKEGEKEEKKNKRLTVTLTEPNKSGCSIFSYENLVKKDKEKTEPKKVNGSEPFPGDDDADVARLAKHYEDKYNDRRYTYAELGAGYDESDSFIDNTEICEEEFTNDECKRYKGFYINKEKFDSDDESEKKMKRRRRSTALSDSDSTSDSRSKKKIKHDKKKIKKKHSSSLPVPLPNGSKVSDSSMSGSSSSGSDSES